MARPGGRKPFLNAAFWTVGIAAVVLLLGQLPAFFDNGTSSAQTALPSGGKVAGADTPPGVFRPDGTTLGDWTIVTGRQIEGCTATTALRDENGEAGNARFAFAVEGGNSQLIVYNPPWSDAAGVVRPIGIGLDDAPARAANLTAGSDTVSGDNFYAGRAPGAGLFDMIVASKTLRVVAEGKALTAKLGDIAAIGKALRACQAHFDASKAALGDPAAPPPAMLHQIDGRMLAPISPAVRRFGNAGNWTIQTHTDNRACVTQAIFEDGTALMIGFNPGEKRYFLMIVNDQWKAADPLVYVMLDLDGRPVARGLERLRSTGDVPPILSFPMTLTPPLIDRITHSGQLRLRFPGYDVLLDLSGAGAAMRKLDSCQAAA